MHICHVISGYFRNDARVFLRQCLTLVDAGHQVTIITNDGAEDQTIDTVDILNTGKIWPRWRTLLFAKKQFLKKCATLNADVYQLHSPELLPLGLKLKKLGYKVVYDAHEDMEAHILEKEWLPKFVRKPLSVLTNIYMLRTLKKFDEVISPHSHVIEKLNKKLKKGILIANFPIIKPLPDNHFDNFTDRLPIFCYSGTVYPYSNQVEIIRSVLNTHIGKYEIAGVIADDLYTTLSEISTGDKVVFNGRIDQSSLRKLYFRSICGLAVYDYKLNLGYKRGSYGTNKLFEYMEAGLPIICTDYELWKEIIDFYKCGFYVVPGDEIQITEAMMTLIRDPEKARKMGENARKAALEKFNWVTEAQKYRRIFDEMECSNA